MKTFILTTALALACGAASAQKMKEANVPSAVKSKFVSLYPNTKNAKWEKEGNNYEAEFDVNKVETSVSFDPNGNLVETETEISTDALPQGAKDYVKNNLGGKKISEASKIVAADGGITYEAEVGGTDYIFDASGNFVRKEQGD